MTSEFTPHYPSELSQSDPVTSEANGDLTTINLTPFLSAHSLHFGAPLRGQSLIWNPEPGRCRVMP